MKGKMTALQFGAEWERQTAELEEVGLALDAERKALDYIIKVGADGEKIRMDRRERPDGRGGWEFRTPKTWEEFHAVLVEI